MFFVCLVSSLAVESFPFIFWHCCNKLEPHFELLLPFHYYGLSVGFIPFRAIVNKKQCETRYLFILLLYRCVCDVQKRMLLL